MKKESSQIIINPVITEKASFKAENSVYVFNVHKDSNKTTIEKAFKDLYKISPVKVSIVNTKPKNVFVRGKRGVKSGYKKAYVYLKKGEKIEI